MRAVKRSKHSRNWAPFLKTDESSSRFALFAPVLVSVAVVSACGIGEHEYRRLPSPNGAADAVWFSRSDGPMGGYYHEGLFITAPGRHADSGILALASNDRRPKDLNWVDSSTLEILYTGGELISPPVRQIETTFAGTIKIRARTINSPFLKSSSPFQRRRAVITGATVREDREAVFSAEVKQDEEIDLVRLFRSQIRMLDVYILATDLENIAINIFPDMKWVGNPPRRKTLKPFYLDDLEFLSDQTVKTHFVLANNRHVQRPWDETGMPVDVTHSTFTPIDISYQLREAHPAPIQGALIFSFRTTDGESIKLVVQFSNVAADD